MTLAFCCLAKQGVYEVTIGKCTLFAPSLTPFLTDVRTSSGGSHLDSYAPANALDGELDHRNVVPRVGPVSLKHDKVNKRKDFERDCVPRGPHCPVQGSHLRGRASGSDVIHSTCKWRYLYRSGLATKRVGFCSPVRFLMRCMDI